MGKNPEQDVKTRIQKTLDEAYKLHMRDLTSMKRLVDEALELSRKESDSRGESRCHHMLSIYWGICGDYNRSLENAYTSLRILQDLNDTTGQSSTYNNIGMIHSRMGESDEAFKYFQLARDIAMETDDRKGLFHAVINLANYHQYHGNLEESLSLHSRALEIGRDLGLDDQIALALVNIGDLQITLGLFEDAKKNLQEGLELSRKTANSFVEIVATMAIAKVQAEQNREPEALEMLEGAMALARKLNNSGHIIAILQTRADILEKQGNYAEALETTREFHELQDRLRSEKSTNRLQQLTASFEIEKKEKEAEIYRLRNIELREAKNRAEEADRAKGSFLAMMSHEIRTPLSIICGMLELLSESSLDAQQQKRVKKSVQASQSLLNIINDILDLSKIEAGKVEYVLVPVSIEELLKTNVSLFESDSRSSGFKLITEHDEAIPSELMGDPDRIGQVVRNLVGNAVKFTEEGSVVVSTSLVSLDGDTAHVIFSVSDSGPGIERDDLLTLFKPFSQGKAGRKHMGTGLGLSISRMLVEDMGGRIWAESDPGSGSVFTFELPLRVPEPVSDTVKGTEEQLDQVDIAGMDIMLVDDNPSINEIATLFLSSFECNVTAVSSGREAVDICKSNEFDLILMDVQMPGMTGPEATMALRDMGVGTPVIAVTGHAMSNEQEAYFNAGMNDVVAKPFSRNDLLRILYKWRESSHT